MEIKSLNLRVVDTVFDPSKSDRKVYVKKSGEYTLYKVWLFLEGVDLPFVNYVTYRLHSSFRNPNRTIYRTAANPNCQLIIWTWGLFTINVEVVDKTGVHYVFDHRMGYDRELQNVPAENYVWVTR
jgi:transcription initiation factor IIF auxiliary subunit